MTLRNRLILAFTAILILAVVPITMFTSKITPFSTILGEKKSIENSLVLAVDNARTPEQLETATSALQEYRQFTALKEPLRLEFIRFSILLVFVLFLLSMLIVLLYVKHITRPLQELTLAAQRIGNGDISIHLNRSKDKEFNKLIDSFNSMLSALREAQEKLKLTERHSAWQEMSRMLAHEIKNPLTALQLSTQRLREKYVSKSSDLPEVIDKTTKVMEAEVKNFITMVNKFSEFAHLPSPSFKPANINEVIKESVTLYKNIPCVFFEENYDNSIADIPVDSGQIKQVFNNLIKNAIEAKKDNKPCNVEVFTKNLENEIEIVLNDDGKGISDEDMEHIFHPYFTTKEGGSGLGLIITERIITAHSGKINVESKIGEGTKISIRLTRIS